MNSSSHFSRRYGLQVLASTALTGLVLLASVSHADTRPSASDEQPPAVSAPESEVSIWVEAAPLDLVIRQLAHLSGKSVEIESLDEATVSGRFSGSLGSVLEDLTTDYPVVFDVDGNSLRAMGNDARKSASIPMLSTDISDATKQELLSAAVSGNKVEIRANDVLVTGHPAFVKRQSKAVATVEARLRADVVEPAQSVPADNAVIADSGSAEVLVDIEDEGKPPADQATLSRPIRWVTDIPGYTTF